MVSSSDWSDIRAPELALKNVLNLNDYLSVFWYFLAFGEGFGLFDLLVIDLLWWRRTGSLDRHAVLNHTS